MLELIQSAPSKLRQLLVCQLLSGPGQRAMLSLEKDYLVDVPLALTHLIVSGHANQLVTLTIAPPLAGGGAGDQPLGGPAAVTAAGAPQTQSVSTLALACRMLLQGTRLEELVLAMFDDLEEAEKPQRGNRQPSRDTAAGEAGADAWADGGGRTAEQLLSSSPARTAAPSGLVSESKRSGCLNPQQQQHPQQRPQQQQPPPAWVSDVVSATAALMLHLHCLDMQLLQFRARCGLGIGGGLGSDGSSSVLSLLERGSACLSERGGDDSGRLLRLTLPEAEDAQGNTALAWPPGRSSPRAVPLGGFEEVCPYITQAPTAEPAPRREGSRLLLHQSIAALAVGGEGGVGSMSGRSLADSLDQFRQEQLSPVEQVNSWRVEHEGEEAGVVQLGTAAAGIVYLGMAGGDGNQSDEAVAGALEAVRTAAAAGPPEGVHAGSGNVGNSGDRGSGSGDNIAAATGAPQLSKSSLTGSWKSRQLQALKAAVWSHRDGTSGARDEATAASTVLPAAAAAGSSSQGEARGAGPGSLPQLLATHSALPLSTPVTKMAGAQDGRRVNDVSSTSLPHFFPASPNDTDEILTTATTTAWGLPSHPPSITDVSSVSVLVRHSAQLLNLPSYSGGALIGPPATYANTVPTSVSRPCSDQSIGNPSAMASMHGGIVEPAKAECFPSPRAPDPDAGPCKGLASVPEQTDQPTMASSLTPTSLLNAAQPQAPILHPPLSPQQRVRLTPPLSLTPVSTTTPVVAKAAAATGWPAVLVYGNHTVLLNREQYRAVRSMSGLLREWLSASSRQALHAVLRVPGFSDEENAVAVQCLAAAGNAEGGTSGTLSPGPHRIPDGAIPACRATLMWHAAHFYQADTLKGHCEDLLISGLHSNRVSGAGSASTGPSGRAAAAAPYSSEAAAAAGDQSEEATVQALSAVLELVSLHTDDSTSRLLHLCCLWLMQHLGGRKLLGCRDAVLLLYRHRDVLRPALLEHVRDQLVTLVMLSDDLCHE